MVCFHVLAFVLCERFSLTCFPNKIPVSQVSTCLLEFRTESDVKRSQSLLIPVGKCLLQNISNIFIYYKPKP